MQRGGGEVRQHSLYLRSCAFLFTSDPQAIRGRMM